MIAGESTPGERIRAVPIPGNGIGCVAGCQSIEVRLAGQLRVAVVQNYYDQPIVVVATFSFTDR